MNETIDRFADRTDVVFASRHWPTWGSDRVREFLADTRDMYQFLHDQTLRLINSLRTAREVVTWTGKSVASSSAATGRACSVTTAGTMARR